MTEKIYQLAYELKDSLKNDPRVIKLNELDNKLSNNDEVMLLARKKDVANDKYNDACRFFGSESKEASLTLKELHEAKLELDNHILVKEYNKAYQEVRMLLDEINRTLFSCLNENSCPNK